jgi:iron(III) transport system substrate-binding protein
MARMLKDFNKAHGLFACYHYGMHGISGAMPRRYLWLAAGALLGSGLPAQAQTTAALVAGAKAEKEVVYYTELIVDQIVRPLAAAFERKYGIKVTYWRGDSQAAAVKLAIEHQAGRTSSDVWSTASGIGPLRDAGLIEPFAGESAAALPAGLHDPEGYWASTNIIVIGAAANTDLVAPADRPASYEDLLEPKWRGRMAWKPNDVTGAWGFIGNVLAMMGEERGLAYLRRLAGQNLAPVGASTRAILDGVIAGEHALVLGVSAHNTEISRRAGAPVVFLPLGSAWATLHMIGVTRGAPHPRAGRLFVDFALSREGQEIFRNAGYLPARADVPPLSPAISPKLAGFAANVISPEALEHGLAHWSDVYASIFR